MCDTITLLPQPGDRVTAGRAYDAVAAQYDFRLWEHEGRLALLKTMLLPHMREPVLDIGTGTGLLWDWFPHAAGKGYDPSRGMLYRARRKHPGRTASLEVGNALTYRPTRAYPCVTALHGSLSYVTIHAAIAALKVSLMPGGRFFVMLYGRQQSAPSIWRRIDVHTYRYPIEQVRRIFKAEFAAVSVTAIGWLQLEHPTAISIESMLLTRLMPHRAAYYVVTGKR